MKRFALAFLTSLCCSAMAAGNHSAESKMTEYTYETVAAYAESWEFAIRWGAGTIKVVDETGVLKREPKILEILNMNLGTTKMVLVDGPKGDLVIKLVDELPAPYGQIGCGLSQSQLGADGAQVVSNIIRIKRNNRCMGKNEGAALVLHELGHALGFAKHAKEDDVMSQHDPAFELNHINLSTLQHFLKGLYTLDVGAKIPGKKRMPSPAPESLAYYAPISDSGPVLALKPPLAERLPESTFATPTQQYRRVEKLDAKGRVFWEFVQISGSAGSVTEIPSNVPGVNAIKSSKSRAPAASRFETIKPGTASSSPKSMGSYNMIPAATGTPTDADDASRGFISFGPRR